MKTDKRILDFLNTTLPTPKGGVLTVKDFTHVEGTLYYILHCSICSEDKELFKEPIKSTRVELTRKRYPCGCAKAPKWSKEQSEVLFKRRCEELGFEYLGIEGDFKGVHSRLRIYNPSTDNFWNTSSFLVLKRKGLHDPILRSESIRKSKGISLKERETQISKILGHIKGDYLGLEEDYKGSHTKFSWLCKNNHKISMSITNFLRGQRCKHCSFIKQKEQGLICGYLPDRKDEIDNLYVIHFKKDGIIKIGRTLNFATRLVNTEGLLSKSDHEITDLCFLGVFKGTHEKIFKAEQEIQEELTVRGFHAQWVPWTTEGFHEDAKDIALSFCRSYDFKEDLVTKGKLNKLTTDEVEIAMTRANVAKYLKTLT